MPTFISVELLFGTKIVIKGDKLKEGDCPMIIINHRCRLDWMFYWMAAQRVGRLQNEKIIMKRELKFVPGPGKFRIMEKIVFTIYLVIYY